MYARVCLSVGQSIPESAWWQRKKEMFKRILFSPIDTVFSLFMDIFEPKVILRWSWDERTWSWWNGQRLRSTLPCRWAASCRIGLRVPLPKEEATLIGPPLDWRVPKMPGSTSRRTSSTVVDPTPKSIGNLRHDGMLEGFSSQDPCSSKVDYLSNNICAAQLSLFDPYRQKRDKIIVCR